MLLTDKSFAEKIIEKYSFVKPYYFDNDLLVFHRENPWSQTKTSAVSYIELALKLLFAVQNYCESGQQSSLNWNMVNQVILKQTAVISAKTEKILFPVRKEINRLLLEKKQEKIFRTEIGNRQISFGKSDTRQQTLDSTENDVKQQISVFGREQARQQILFEERVKEQLRFFREEKIRRQNQKLDKELNLRESEKLIQRKIELYSKTERQNKLRVSLEKQSENKLGTHLASWKWSNFQISKWISIQSQNFLFHLLQNQLHDSFENQLDFEKIKFLDIQSSKLSGKQIYLENIISNLLKIATQREIAQQRQTLIDAELEIQKFAVEESRSLFYKSMELQTKKQRYRNSGYQALQASARWLQRITSLFLTLSQKTEIIFSQTGKQIQKLILTNAISERKIIRADTKDFQQLPINFSLKSAWHQWDYIYIDQSQLSQRFWHLSHKERQIAWQSLSELKEISRHKSLLEKIIQLNHIQESDVLSTSKALEPSWDIMIHKMDTNLSFQKQNKSSLTRLAEEEFDAIQKLFQLLLLVSSKSRVQEQLKRFFYNYKNNIVQYMQQPKETLLSSGFIKRHEFILYRQGKWKISVQESEERIRAFIKLLEKPKVLAAVRKQMEKVQKEKSRKNSMTQQHSDYRVVTILNLEKQEKRQMISQVRQNFGIEAAKKLEQYLILKEQVSGYATDHESQRQINDLAKSMIGSYYKINWTKALITAMGTDRENYLYNQIREKVHEPPEKSVNQLRNNLDLIMWLVQRKHKFGQAKFNIPTYRSGTSTYFHTLVPKPDSSEISAPRDDLRTAIFEKPQEWGQAQTEFFRKQKADEDQIEQTKRLMTTLHKKVEIQEKLLTELKKGVRQRKVPEPININNLTRQVMRKMEDELRIEKMRRGLL